MIVRRPCYLFILAAGLVMAMFTNLGPAWAGVCPTPGQWQDGEGGKLARAALFKGLAERKVVLLGERHDRAEHHRWQLHTLAALHGRNPDMSIALEMLPREAQPALDDWVAGQLDEEAFVEASGWQEHWGFTVDLYLPILHFARMHGIPLRAINVDKRLGERLVSEGWEVVPDAERHGMTPPVAAPDDYRDYLESVYRHHPMGGDEADGLERFIKRQLVWDRAMAHGLSEAGREAGLVVALIGQGHLRHGHGVPHQLGALGIDDVQVLLPWEGGEGCRAPEPGIAHALFGIESGSRHEAPEPQMLGIVIEPHDSGIRVLRVGEDSVASRAGLEANDVIIEAAGRPVRASGDLIDIVRDQPPGTVLPLVVQRGSATLELLPRFDPQP